VRVDTDPSIAAPERLLDSSQHKTWATLRARLALAGFSADLIEDDRGRPEFVVSRWCLTRSFQTLDQVAEFADRAGAPA